MNRSTLLGKVPPSVLRLGGRLERSVPALAPAIRRAARSLQTTDGVIAHGEGRGLRINPAGANPGFVLGTSEPDVQQAIVRLLEPGMTFYDVGANVGFHALIAARRVGPEGRVHAFEPLPRNAAALAHNVALNDLDNVEVIEAAVGARPGRAALAVTAESVQAHLVEVDTGVGTVETREVSVTSIDAEVIAGRPAPDVVKIDVEGAELLVLYGMVGTLEAVGPTLICELHAAEPGANDEACDLLEHLGYRLEPLLPGGPIRDSDHPVHVCATLGG